MLQLGTTAKAQMDVIQIRTAAARIKSSVLQKTLVLTSRSNEHPVQIPSTMELVGSVRKSGRSHMM